MRIFKWIKAWGATALWGYVLTGAYGLLEAIFHYFQLPSDFSVIRSLSPYVTVYGWAGFFIAGLLYLPSSLLSLHGDHKYRRSFALAVAGAISTITTLHCLLLMRDVVMEQWWAQNGLLWGKLILLAVWFLGVVILLHLITQLARKIRLNPVKSLLFPVMVVILSSSLWPNWQEEGMHSRTDYLTAKQDDNKERPNLILISIDTLRSDALGCNGGTQALTPVINEFASQGITYTNFWSSSCWTLPSMSTLLTGFSPRSLGVKQFSGLPLEVNTLSEVAFENGYQTSAIVSNPYLSDFYGFDRGFEWHEQAITFEPLLPAQNSALVKEITRIFITRNDLDDGLVICGKAINWLKHRDNNRPLFMWVHMMEPHLPYRAIIPNSEKKMLLPAHHWFAEGEFHALEKQGKFFPAIEKPIEEAIKKLYNTEVEYSDYIIGQLLDGLKEAGLYQNSIIVIVSDHGEELFDHGGFEHGHSFLPEVSVVPLIVRFPNQNNNNRVVNQHTSMLNFFTSICYELDWEYGMERPGNENLFDQDLVDEPFIVLENVLYGEEQTASVSPPYIRIESDEVQWFLLGDDIVQRTTAPADSLDWPIRINQWKTEMDQYLFDSNPFDEGPALNVRRELKSLGY
jgi:hypothetical protein